jgi:hypothetical protein
MKDLLLNQMSTHSARRHRVMSGGAKRMLLISGGIILLSLLIVGVAFAYSAGNVDGIWSTIDGGGGASCDRWATGPGDTPTTVQDAWWNQTPPNTDENQVRYGGGFSCSTTFPNQSGFGFDGNDSVGTVAPYTPFYLGRFTHYNNPISASNSFGSVNLDVTVGGITCLLGETPTEGSTMTFTYAFTLDETSNSAPCAYSPVIPPTNYCPDQVTVGSTPSTQQFTCPEGVYTVNILGFTAPDPASGLCPPATYPGSTSSTFVTQEGTDNNACLWAEISDYVQAVTLSSFTATGAPKSVVLSWVTTSETDNLGFNLYRSTLVNGNRTKVNAQLIPSQVYPGSPSGAVYSFTDTSVKPLRTYYYWLEDVDIHGATTLNGPVKVRVK